MTDIDLRPVTATLRLIGGPFEETLTKSYFPTDEAVEQSYLQRYVESGVHLDALYFLRRKVPGGRVLTGDVSDSHGKGILIDDGTVRWLYVMTAEAQRGAPVGVFPYTFVGSQPSSPYYVFDRRDWSEWPLPRVPLGDGTAYQCEEFPLTLDPCFIDGRLVSLGLCAPVLPEGQASTPLADIRAARETLRNLADPLLRSSDTVVRGALPAGQVHPFWTQLAQRFAAGEVVPTATETLTGSEWVLAQPEVPTTYCFDCGQMVPIADTWTKKNDPNYALCEGCFRAAEGAGRAKESQ